MHRLKKGADCRLTGDPYKDGFLKTPVILKPGENRVLFKVSGFGAHDFSFKIIPVPGPLMISEEDITRPDLIRGEPVDICLGIPLVNTTRRRLDDLTIKAELMGTEKVVAEAFNLMPLCAVKIPIKIKSDYIPEKEESLAVNIRISTGDFSVATRIWLQIKDAAEPRIETFISEIDGSCQYYAVSPPLDYSPDSTYALIMTCHGAGVKAFGLVKSYIRKDWAFVVAPTNRRRFGFDWQDWGRLDFFEVLNRVKERFKIDTNRIYLTGHSMGGHGVWHIGLSHPDVFAGMAPSAGWTNFRLYVPWFLQKAKIFAEPQLIKFRDMVLREDACMPFLENAYNLPIYILQGGADDNVPPIQSRLFVKGLNALGYEFVYNEVVGKKHWWDFDTTPGIDCVDLKEMMDFLKAKTRDPYPQKIVFRTTDIGHSNRCYWIEIDEQEELYKDSRVIAEVVGKKSIMDPWEYGEAVATELKIELVNVARFTIFLNDSLVSPGLVNLVINGQNITFEYRKECRLSFRKTGDKFLWATDEVLTTKRPGVYGPIKRAYFSPFVLIYGTTGDALSTEHNFELARLQAYFWWYRANGFVRILPDTEVTREIIENYNLILFGNAVTNSVLKWINHRLPLRIEKGSVIVGDRILTQKDLCLIEIYPNPLNPEKFVLLYAPTTKKAEEIMGMFIPLYAGAGLPDFVVYDRSVLKYGWAGVKAAGFFDKNWEPDRKLIYIKK